MDVYDKKSSKYILGIECDGAAFHSSKFDRERDIYRQRYLESRGRILLEFGVRTGGVILKGKLIELFKGLMR